MHCHGGCSVKDICQAIGIMENELFPTDMGWPVIDTRTAQTTVYVKSGETIILGGLIADDIKLYKRKVPLLGDIPFLGKLFRYKYEIREKKNLLIFVTATVLNKEEVNESKIN